MSTLRKASNPFEALGILPPPGPQTVPPAPTPETPPQAEPTTPPATAVAAPAHQPPPPGVTSKPAPPRPASSPKRSAAPAKPKPSVPAQKRSLPVPQPDERPRRTERVQINVTRRTKLLLQAEEIERRKRGLKPRERDETTLIEQAVEKAYGHLWREYAWLLGDTEAPGGRE